jgi:hypothetical protein
MDNTNTASAGEDSPDLNLHLIDRPDIAAPNVRADVGAFRITSATPFLLGLRARNTPAVLLILGGFALAGWIVFGTAVSVWNLIRGGDFEVPNKLALILGLIGAFALFTGLARFGLTYTIDGATRTVRRRRLFGRDTVWNGADISHVRLVVQPASADAWSGRERLLITVHDQNGEELGGEPLFGFLRTATPGAVEGARAAVLAGRILRVPVWAGGVVEKGSDELRKLLTPAGR